MIRFITKSEIEQMAQNILDEETGMSDLDLVEWQGLCEDWVIIDG